MNAYVKSEALLETLEALQRPHRSSMDECDAETFNFDVGFCQACRVVAQIVMSDEGKLTLNGYDAFAEYVLSKERGKQ